MRCPVTRTFWTSCSSLADRMEEASQQKMVQGLLHSGSSLTPSVEFEQTCHSAAPDAPSRASLHLTADWRRSNTSLSGEIGPLLAEVA